MSELPSLPPLELRAPVTAPPTKRIASDGDMLTWQGSEAHDLILHFIARLAAACVQAPTRAVVWARDAHDGPDMIERVLALLIELDAWTDEIEPLQGPQRFGNLAFRTWGARLTERVEALHRKLLPTELHAAIPELTPYLLDAFGSFIRIDYGTGHELHWIAWLCVLCRLGVWGQPASRDAEARLALEVVPAYLRVVWHLQDRYALEPAGSHGVWGLDDYQFLPYILGASQLLGTDMTPLGMVDTALYPFIQGMHRHGPRLSPEDTLTYVTPRAFAPQPNLYTSSLARIHALKRGPFAEHSPILYDIARHVATWPKVYAGMLKMYDAECLLKRPVVQHFPFGTLGFVWPAPDTASAAAPRTALPTGAPRQGPGSLAHMPRPPPSTMCRPPEVPGRMAARPGRMTAPPRGQPPGT